MKKTFSRGKIAAIVVIIAVIIIPMLYSYFYLGAFWDPYSRLEKLPVAVVNKDQGAIINDKNRNAGQEMCDELKKDGSLKFIFTDEQDAKTGTEGKEYYAMIVIPKNFSENIASASTTEKKKAIITYSSNEKRNYLASQILNRAILEVEEKTRSKINKELVQELVDNIKDLPGQMSELQDGLGKLNDGSADLKKGSDKIVNGTQTYKDKFADYAKGVTKAKNGAASLKEGAASLKQGASSLKEGTASLKNGAVSVNDGAATLKNGAVSLDNGLNKLLNGANQLTASTKDINKLSDGAKNLSDGAKSLNTGIMQYTTGVDNLIATANTSSAFFKQLITSNPALLKDPQVAAFAKKLSDPANAQSIATLQAASTQLKAASTQISQGAAMLSDNTSNLPKLKEGIKTLSKGLADAKTGSSKLAQGSAKLASGTAALKSGSVKVADGTEQLANGSTKLANGSNTLYSGMTKLDSATSKLSSAADKIADGTEKISNGAKKLHKGTDKAKSGLDDSILDSKDDTKKLDGLANYAKAPVSIKEDRINPVPNYGTAFAPYFLSLSLWVGALIMFVIIYLDADNKFGILSRYSNKVVIRSFIFLLISFAQALVLAFCVKFGLGLKEKDTFLYYSSCCLVSMVFLSVVQFLMVHFKDVGKFLTILLLILQLTSCGGTFPMETLPKFYKILYPFMPMTYSVGIFKQAISGVRNSELAYNSGVLISILVVFMTLTILLSVIKLRVAKKKAAKNVSTVNVY